MRSHPSILQFYVCILLALVGFARAQHSNPTQTPVKPPARLISPEVHADGSVTVHNVPAYRLRHEVVVEAPGHGRVVGDVAWGGNWFFLVAEHGLDLQSTNIEALTNFSWQVREALEDAAVTGADGAPIDHIELFSASATPQIDSRNFVLCPGKAYDRSPCGTGTSAKIACLAAEHKLAEGEIWRQESIIGSVFEASYRRDGERVLPSIRGHAHVNAEATLILNDDDPFVWGIR